jgi:hypothetical protein
LLFENDHRRETEANQQQVEGEASGSAIAVNERMDLFEVTVNPGEVLGQ